MTKEELIQELSQQSKSNICDIICKLMDNNIIDITDINTSYIQHIGNILAEKENIINSADECIYESLFYDSIGKPSDTNNTIKKLKWIEKLGNHNLDGILKLFKKHN